MTLIGLILSLANVLMQVPRYCNVALVLDDHVASNLHVAVLARLIDCGFWFLGLDNYNYIFLILIARMTSLFSLAK